MILWNQSTAVRLGKEFCKWAGLDPTTYRKASDMFERDVKDTKQPAHARVGVVIVELWTKTY